MQLNIRKIKQHNFKKMDERPKDHFSKTDIHMTNKPEKMLNIVHYCCCCSVEQLCPTLCDPMDCSTPSLPVPHHLPEFVQVHVHCIGGVVHPSHPLMPSFFCPQSFPESGTFPMSCLFASDDQNTGASASASVLPVNIQRLSTE